MISQEHETFEIEVDLSKRTITIHSTAKLGENLGRSGLIVVSPNTNDGIPNGFGELGVSMIEKLFIKGVTEMDFWPYYLKIKLARLFVDDMDDLHRKVEEFILERWPNANITGARYDAQEAYIHFVITSGPDWETIRRVLDGNSPEGDPHGWEALEFTGHKPGSDIEETVTMRFGRLIGRRDLGVDKFSEYRERPPQGERIIWDLIPGSQVSIGPKPTAYHLKRYFHHPDAQQLHGVFIRFNDVTGVGEILDIEALENK